MSHRQQLLDTMAAMRTELEGQLIGLDPEAPADGGAWRWQDTLAHIALWERVAVKKITGEPLPYGEDVANREPWDLDAFNDAMIERFRAWSARDVLDEFAAAHQALRAVVEQASEEECAPGGRVWTIVDEDGAGHYPGHFPIADLMGSSGQRQG